MIGKTLGHYQITNQLGKGGMGEVYVADDLNLGRKVALKFLPDSFAGDPERMARFEREAKLLASLNHPNIAAIYGFEQAEGKRFIVMELVEGETLSDFAKATSDKAVPGILKLALQIAEGLEAAHEKGVIHRDLKPANVMITEGDKVKILDFGLAKALSDEAQAIDSSQSPTITEAMTKPGIILGTAAYMSPEQARGKTVDKRTDIWAFGVVLFEMLTGRPVFSGEDVNEVLAAVIRAEPDWSTLPKTLHWRMRELIQRCLAKDPKERYHDISDVRLDIQKAMADPSSVWMQPGPKKSTLPWIAAIFLTAVIAGSAVWYLKPTSRAESQVIRLYHEVPQNALFMEGTSERAIAISPDGRQLAYSSRSGIFLRLLDQLDARLLTGTEGANNLVFSPDGRWIGYVAHQKLKKIAVTGGAPVVLTGISTAGIIRWGADDAIVYSQPGKGIMRISANDPGRTPDTLVKAENGLIIGPQLLPDGKTFLYTTMGASSTYRIMMHSLASTERHELLPGIVIQYLSTGYLVYQINNDVFAIRFDPHGLKPMGGPIAIAGSVLPGQCAISDSGTLVYFSGTAVQKLRTLVWVDRNGLEEPITPKSDVYSHPRISPDGTRVALTVGPMANSDIWVRDLIRKTMIKVTGDESRTDVSPLWTPDGKRIIFRSNREGSPKIYWKAADGSGKDESLESDYAGEFYSFPSSWSGDGKTILLTGTDFTMGLTFDIAEFSTEGRHQMRMLLKEAYSESEPHVSPNGRWVAYTSDETGHFQVYVSPYPDVGSGGRWLVSTDGGCSPLWSPDGRELYYRNGNAVMAVSVKTQPDFNPETPRILFEGNYLSSGDALEMNSWDISVDGRRFLMLKTNGEPATGSPKINIVVNWSEELKQRMLKK